MSAAQIIANASTIRARLMNPPKRGNDPDRNATVRRSETEVHFGSKDGLDGIKPARDGYTAEFYRRAIANKKARERKRAHDALVQMEAERRELLRKKHDAIVYAAIVVKAERDAMSAELLQRRLDAEKARIAGKARIQQSKPKIQTVEMATCHHFRLLPDAMKSKKRLRTITYPRQICAYICYEYTRRSFSEIGRYFGFDHTSILHGHRKIRDLVVYCEETREAVRDILELIGMGSKLKVAS